MAGKRRALGTGLAALIPAAVNAPTKGQAETARTSGSAGGNAPTKGQAETARTSGSAGGNGAPKVAQNGGNGAPKVAQNGVNGAPKVASGQTAKILARGSQTNQTNLVANDQNGTPKSTPKSSEIKMKSAAVKGEKLGTSKGTAVLFGAPEIKEELVSAGDARFQLLKINDILALDVNPRSEFEEQKLKELSDSIAQIGVIQPVRVRKNPDYADGKAHFQLIAGERRLRASKIAGLKEIPAIIAETKDEDVLVEALVENIQRVDLNPLEEATAYKMLIDDYSLTQEQLALRVAKSRPQIANMLRLLKAPQSVQMKIASGVLSAGHARALLGLKNSKQIEETASLIVKEGLSVRQTEERIALISSENKDSNVDLSKKSVKAVKNSKNVAAFQEIAQNLADHLETVVNINLKKGDRGSLSIEFADLEDLKRISSLIK